MKAEVILGLLVSRHHAGTYLRCSMSSKTPASSLECSETPPNQVLTNPDFLSPMLIIRPSTLFIGQLEIQVERL